MLDQNMYLSPMVLRRLIKEGDIVDVAKRTWSGINKPGGRARVFKTIIGENIYFSSNE